MLVSYYLAHNMELLSMLGYGDASTADDRQYL